MASGDDSFYRCYKALHLVTHEATPCVDNALKVWHTSQQQTLSPCTGQCPAGKKPKLPASCQNCVDWANAIEGVYYQPPLKLSGTPTNTQKQIPWRNMNPSMLYGSYVEVAKAFVLRLPTGVTTPSTTTTTTATAAAAAATTAVAATQATTSATSTSTAVASKTSANVVKTTFAHNYTQISDFDSASLLMIMARFSEFLKGDTAAYDLTEKVAAIRNELSHIPSKDDMEVDAKKVKEYFKTFNDFLCCLETLHPHHFTSAQEIKARLKEIEMEPVTKKMKEELMNDIFMEIKEVKRMEGEVQAVSQEIRLLKRQSNYFKAASYYIYRFVYLVIIFILTRLPFNFLGDCSSEANTLNAWRGQLITNYKDERGKLPLLPGMPEEFADMDELYIPLKLLKDNRTSRIPLKSYPKLFSLKTKDGNDVRRILIKAGPGGGKTTTISKIAYDWAKKNAEKPGCFPKCKLLFVLDLRTITPEMSLIGAIQDQLLPSVSSECLASYISSHSKSIYFVLDGFDEASWLGDPSLRNSNNFRMLLRKKWLPDSLVIVTTRSQKVSNYTDRFGICTQVQLVEFSDGAISKYVGKLFNVHLKYITPPTHNLYCPREIPPPAQLKDTIMEVDALLLRILNRPKERSLAKIPIMLTMICMLWQEDKCLPGKTTELFQEAFLYIANHNLIKYKKSDVDYEQLEREVDKTLKAVGEIALKALLEDTQQARLVFEQSEFPLDHLDNAITLGIVSRERTRSKRLQVRHSISFTHKIFQEFSAAKFLVSLKEVDEEQFKALLSNITLSNIGDVDYIMQFCCGLNNEAAEIIVPHFVQVLKGGINRYGAELDCSGYNRNDMFSPALLLLTETQSKTSYRHLETLFQIAELNVKLGNHSELLPALDYFLNCQMDAPADSILNKIPAVQITVMGITEMIMQVCEKLLQCMPKLYSLRLSLPDIKYRRESCVVSMAERIGKLQSLKHLHFSGVADYDCVIKTFNSSMISSTQITHLTIIGCTKFNTDIMREFLSKLLNLTSFALLGNSDTCSIEFTGISLVSKKLRILSVTHYRISTTTYLRTLLSTLYMLHLENLEYEVCNKVFSALYDVGKKTFREYKSRRSQTLLRCKHLRFNSIHATKVSAKLLAKAFQFMPRLTVLNLRQADITEDGFKLIAEALPELKNLREINLSNNYTSMRKASIDIARSLGELPKLEKIFMRNALKEEGVAELGKSLHNLPNVRMLKLNKTHIRSGISDLFSGIQTLKCLQELNLRNTVLRDEDLANLPLKELLQLNYLDIGGECHGRDLEKESDDYEQIYTPRGVKIVFENLHHLKKLTYLEISYHKNWLEDIFWSECCKKCIPKKLFVSTLTLEREHIESVMAFVTNN